jgi:hypothetical protein
VPTATALACPSGHRADGNLCEWRGTPTYISGTSVYSRGEFIHSDYIHDDAGANVDGFTSNNPDPPQPVTGIHAEPYEPTNPDFGGAADDADRFQWSGDFGYPASGVQEYNDNADILEFRQALDNGQLHFLVKLGDMSAANSTVIGIGIDSDRNAATGAGEWPLGANMQQQLGYDYFITMWGTGGQLTDYTGATPVTTPINVVANTGARPPFMEADVPLPAGLHPSTWREYVGSGLWDAEKGKWALPQPSPGDTAAPGALTVAPYIYNMLFRPYEPNNWWHENTQAEDLEHKNIAQDHADVNAELLANHASTPPPRPTGLINVQYTTQALGSGEGVEGQPSGNIWRGPVQPYSLTLPSNYYSSPHSRRFMLWFHCLFCQQNVWPFGVEHYAAKQQNNLTDPPLGTEHIQEIVNRNDMMVAGTLQRGFKGAGSWGDFPGAGEYDLRDVAETIRNRDHYEVDPNRVMFSGMSMGGSTTQTMMTLYADELAAAVGHSSTGSIARLSNIRDVPYTQITGDTGLDAAASTAGRKTAEEIDALGYRNMYVEYLGRGHDFGLVHDSLPILEGTAYRELRDPNPARVTYKMEAAQEDPALGLVHDHAYWASSLRLPSGAPSASIDATSLALAAKLPKLISHLTGTFLRPSTGDAAHVDWQVWDRDLTGHGLHEFDSRWEPSPDVKVTNTHPAAPEHAGQNAFTMTTSYTAETLNLARMNIKTRKTITGWIDASAPTSLTLKALRVGEGGVSIDGTAASTEPSPTGRGVVVAIPAGKHVLVLQP